VKLLESEPEAVATGQGVNFTSREFQSLIAVTQVLTTTVESLAGRYHHPSRAARLGTMTNGKSFALVRGKPLPKRLSRRHAS
jgi:hypothetical protein